jgi:hypothetical protein
MACLPMVLGISAILLTAIYSLQRSGHLLPPSFGRFVQHHLDGIGIAAFGVAVTGTAVGLYLGRGGRQTRLLFWGTLLCVVGALAPLLLSL